MFNIFENLFDLFYRIYTSGDVVRVMPDKKIKEYLFIQHGIEFEEDYCPCLMKGYIKNFSSSPLHNSCTIVNIIYLDENQTEQWKGRYGYSPFDLIDNYLQMVRNELIIFVPKFMLYADTENYKLIDRLRDLTCILNVILKAYFRSHLIIDKDKKLFTIYAPLVIGLKLIFEMRIADEEDLVDKLLITPEANIKLDKEILTKIKKMSLTELLVYRAVNEFLDF